MNLMPWLVDVAITVAPGTTAPEGSVTVPLISPLPASWALAGEPQSRTAVRRTSRLGSRWRSRLFCRLCRCGTWWIDCCLTSSVTSLKSNG